MLSLSFRIYPSLNEQMEMLVEAVSKVMQPFFFIMLPDTYLEDKSNLN